MIELTALWLPILLSSVFVFIASSVIHMIPLWHDSDYPKMKQEDQLMSALRPFNLAPGEYLVPRPATRKDMKSPEFDAKMKEGPVALITVISASTLMNMGPTLIKWIGYILFLAIGTACIAGNVLTQGTPYMHVFKIVGSISFLAYAGALWPQSIWYGRPSSLALKGCLDALIYASLTAGTFGWLWPH